MQNTETKKQTVLTGHVSPETAYLVADYPYGYTLRCQIRYWLEYKPSKGMRFVSQTTNPKRGNLVWNTPKASTYSDYGVMILNDSNGHIGWTTTGGYDELDELTKWRADYAHAMPKAAQDQLWMFISRKIAFEQAKVAGEVKMAGMVRKEYGSITSPDFGKNPIVTREPDYVLKSDYTAEQLAAFGETLRTPVADGLAQLVNA